MDRDPYRPPVELRTTIESRRFRFFWPRTQGGCIAASVLILPIVLFVTEIFSLFVAQLQIDDLRQPVGNVTIPLLGAYSLILWFRGFLWDGRDKFAVVAGLLFFPLWLAFQAAMALLFLPFGFS